MLKAYSILSQKAAELIKRYLLNLLFFFQELANLSTALSKDIRVRGLSNTVPNIISAQLDYVSIDRDSIQLITVPDTAPLESALSLTPLR